MTSPSTRRFRPRVERLEPHVLLSASPIVDLKPTPIAADARAYLAASTPAEGRQRGAITGLVADARTGTVAGSAFVAYRVRVLPSFLSLFSPTVSLVMRVNFRTSLDAPRPADVRVGFSRNIVPFGGDVRARVAEGLMAFLRHDRSAIAAAMARGR